MQNRCVVKYGFSLSIRIWSSDTPDSVPGEISSLAQVVLVPRVSHSTDLRGNMQNEGRRTVSCSRSRLLVKVLPLREGVLHRRRRAACLEAFGPSRQGNQARGVHHVIDVHAHDSSMASIWQAFTFTWLAASVALRPEAKSPSTRMKRVAPIMLGCIKNPFGTLILDEAFDDCDFEPRSKSQALQLSA